MQGVKQDIKQYSHMFSPENAHGNNAHENNDDDDHDDYNDDDDDDDDDDDNDDGDAGLQKLLHPAIPDGRTWSKFGEHG